MRTLAIILSIKKISTSSKNNAGFWEKWHTENVEFLYWKWENNISLLPKPSSHISIDLCFALGNLHRYIKVLCINRMIKTIPFLIGKPCLTTISYHHIWTYMSIERAPQAHDRHLLWHETRLRTWELGWLMASSSKHAYSPLTNKHGAYAYSFYTFFLNSKSTWA